MLNEEQSMLRDMAAEWVRDRVPVGVARRLHEGARDAGFDRDAYAEMAAMGWCGIIVPEEQGGSDFGYRSLGLILEELGRTLAPSPLLSSALAMACAVRIGGSDEQKARWLPGIADGSVIGTLAVDEGARHAPAETALKAVATGGGWRLDGVKRPVQDGIIADVAVVPARTSGQPGDMDGLTLFLVETSAPGLACHALDQIDARRPAVYRLDGVEVGADMVLGKPGEGGALLEAVLDRARIGMAAEMLGMAAQAFETTVDYLKTRVQFGRLIGSFQALQHRAAEMFAEIELTRSAVAIALMAIDDESPDLPKLASLAKAMAGDTLRRASNEMVQMHGGIGMTHEHDAGLYLKRARVADQCYGNSAFHRERWGRLNGY